MIKIKKRHTKIENYLDKTQTDLKKTKTSAKANYVQYNESAVARFSIILIP